MDPSSSRRRRRDGHDAEPLEEGEFIPGGGYYSSASESDTDDDDDHNNYYSLQSRREEEIHLQGRRVRRLEDILAMGRDAAALPSPTPSMDPESDGTISDDGGSLHRSPASSVGGVAAPAMRPVCTCHVCGKKFGSPKAVAGHMRVHDPRGRQETDQAKRYVAGWAATGKRGWTGGSKGKSVVSSSADELSHSMDGTVLQPAPLSFARSNPSSSLSMVSAKTNLDSGESSSPKSVHNELVVVPPVVNNNPSTEAVVHPPPPAAQQAADNHQLVLQLAPAVPPPPVAAAQGHHQGPAAAAPRREYTCKLCGASYPTHQGLGGHAAGHRNRQKEAEAAAAAAGIAQDGAAAAARGGHRKEHPCDECDKVFPTGVALGGHKRKHYKGPIVQRRNKKQCVAPPLATPAVCMADLTLGLGIKSAGQTSRSPAAAAGRVRLFGIDIGLPAEAPAAQEGTVHTSRQTEAPPVQEGAEIRRQAEAPAVPEEEGSGVTEDSASTGGQRQDEKVERSSTDSLSKESSN